MKRISAAAGDSPSAMVSGRCGPAHSAGFTLLELLIVISIMIIFAGAIAPMVTARTNVSLPASARVVAGNLRFARSLAIDRSASFQVDFDIIAQQITIARTDGTPLVADDFSSMSGSLDGGTWSIPVDDGITGMQEQPVRLEAIVLATSTTPITTVTIEPHGGMSPGLTEDVVIWLGQGNAGDERFVQIRWAWITGNVQIEGPFDAIPAP